MAQKIKLNEKTLHTVTDRLQKFFDRKGSVTYTCHHNKPPLGIPHNKVHHDSPFAYIPNTIPSTESDIKVGVDSSCGEKYIILVRPYTHLRIVLYLNGYIEFRGERAVVVSESYTDKGNMKIVFN